jgi:hypothetical protein
MVRSGVMEFHERLFTIENGDLHASCLSQILLLQPEGSMSFQADVEHNWIAPELLPMTILGIFPEGAAVVFSDEEFTAAIPASNKQTAQLADLFESAAVALDDDFTGALGDYFKFRDELCAPKGYQMLAMLFKQEMDKVKAVEEGNQTLDRTKLACAARGKGH